MPPLSRSDVVSQGVDVSGEKMISAAQELKASVLKSISETGKRDEDRKLPAD
jgi:hypothetical protein